MKWTLAVLPAVFAASIASLVSSTPSVAQEQACPANSESYQVDQTDTGTVTHCRCISGYALNNGVCEAQPAPAPAVEHPALSSNFCSAKARLDVDRNAIAGLGFVSNASSFDDYAAQATNYRNDFILQAADSLFNMLFVDKAVEYAKGLNPWSVNTRITELRKAANGGSTEAIEGALRALARVRNKPAMAPYASNAIGEAANKLFEAVKDAKINVETKKPQSPETPRYIGALILAGKLATTNPWASLAINGTEMARTLAMAYGISQNVDRLSELNDRQMAQLAIYRARLEKDVAAARAAKRAWQHASGQNREPLCTFGLILDRKPGFSRMSRG